MTRREFLKLVLGSAAGSALLGRSSRGFAQPRTSADLIFVGGKVVTMNPRQPTTEALAVRAGRISAVGTRQEIEALRDARTQVVDLAGLCLSPGLIDAHSHLVGYGQMELYFVNIRPPRVHSFSTLRQALAEAAKTRAPGEWIVARGFNEFDEGRFPRRLEIDQATPQNPVLCIHWTGQYGIANTLALKAAGLLKADVKDPYGGRYGRDRGGVPDGTLLHYPAIYSVYQPKMTAEEERRAAEWATNEFVKLGVTCVHDNFCNAPSARQYVQLEQLGRLPLRVRAYPYVWNLEHCRQTLAQVRRYRGPLVRLQGIKLAVDGYPLMYTVPAERQALNIPMHPPDQFQAIISTIHQAGMQVDVHAAGDRGVDLTLDAFSTAAGGDARVRDVRHRIEHYMFRKQDSIARAADMGVPVCTQPAWLEFRPPELVPKIGREPVMGMVPCGSFVRAGVQLSFGADVPASPTPSPLDSIRGAMTRACGAGLRLDPTEKLTFMQCLQAHTLAAAYAAFDERDLGSLEVGKCADLTVWNSDLEAVTEANLGSLAVMATYVGGVRVFTASA